MGLYVKLSEVVYFMNEVAFCYKIESENYIIQFFISLQDKYSSLHSFQIILLCKQFSYWSSLPLLKYCPRSYSNGHFI